MSEPAEITVRYFRFPDGSVGRTETSGDGEHVPPAEAVEIDEAEHQQLLAAVRQAQADHAADLAAADEANQLDDYTALVTAGIPERSARRLSGYTGHQHDQDS
ncbi:hypothetical protein [Microtetraspora malaysiensis]|uniref:Uncharacterized protein n=1 Tax=Microtetraspora malaysiensis TaxID=161358 RepID=A0ABW6SKJ2_9ACTN